MPPRQLEVGWRHEHLGRSKRPGAAAHDRDLEGGFDATHHEDRFASSKPSSSTKQCSAFDPIASSKPCQCDVHQTRRARDEDDRGRFLARHAKSLRMRRQRRAGKKETLLLSLTFFFFVSFRRTTTSVLADRSSHQTRGYATAFASSVLPRPGVIEQSKYFGVLAPKTLEAGRTRGGTRRPPSAPAKPLDAGEVVPQVTLDGLSPHASASTSGIIHDRIQSSHAVREDAKNAKRSPSWRSQRLDGTSSPPSEMLSARRADP